MVLRLAGLEKTQCPFTMGMTIPQVGMVVVSLPTHSLGSSPDLQPIHPDALPVPLQLSDVVGATQPAFLAVVSD